MAGWHDLRGLVQGRIEGLGVGGGLSESGVCAEFDRLVASRWGEETPCRARSFTEGRLRVEVASGVWAGEIRLQLPSLKRELNRHLKDSKIEEIKLIVRAPKDYKKTG